jgi:hypothetical protein
MSVAGMIADYNHLALTGFRPLAFWWRNVVAAATCAQRVQNSSIAGPALAAPSSPSWAVR